jgi:hypothetical protein
MYFDTNCSHCGSIKIGGSLVEKQQSTKTGICCDTVNSQDFWLIIMKKSFARKVG